MSEATVSSWGMSVVRSMSGALSAHVYDSMYPESAYSATRRLPFGTCCPLLAPLRRQALGFRC